MKNTMIGLLVTFASVTASAHIPSSVQKIAGEIKANDTRTIVKEVTNTDGNPCMPEGKSYVVEIQVKQASYNYDKNDIDYSWQTVKTVGIDKQGRKSEVCAE